MLFWGSHPLKEANEDILWNIGTSYDGSKFHYSVLRHCELELKILFIKVICDQKVSIKLEALKSNFFWHPSGKLWCQFSKEALY